MDSTFNQALSAAIEQEKGYYWVRFDHRTPWEITYWDGKGVWTVGGTSVPYYDNYWGQIGPKIKPPADTFNWAAADPSSRTAGRPWWRFWG